MDPAEMLRRGYTRETALRRDRKGRWFDGEVPLRQAHLERAFDGWIDRRPEDGRFCLSNDINWAYVTIDGPPYRVQSLALRADEWPTLHLSGGRSEVLSPPTLRLDAQDALWADVREGRVPARFDRHAMHQLEDMLGEDEDGIFVLLAGERWRPRRVNDPLAPAVAGAIP